MHTALGFSVLYHVFARKQCILCSALRHKSYLTIPFVIFLDFHSTQNGLPLVDSWSHGLDLNQMYPARDTLQHVMKARWQVAWQKAGALTICTEIAGKNFHQMVLVFFWHRKQDRDWVVPFTNYRYIFHFLSTWSLALVMQTTGTENFGRFGKNGKKVIPRKVLPFFRKISTRVNLNSSRNFLVFHTNGKRSRKNTARFLFREWTQQHKPEASS